MSESIETKHPQSHFNATDLQKELDTAYPDKYCDYSGTYYMRYPVVKSHSNSNKFHIKFPNKYNNIYYIQFWPWTDKIEVRLPHYFELMRIHDVNPHRLYTKQTFEAEFPLLMRNLICKYMRSMKYNTYEGDDLDKDETITHDDMYIDPYFTEYQIWLLDRICQEWIDLLTAKQTIDRL